VHERLNTFSVSGKNCPMSN